MDVLDRRNAHQYSSFDFCSKSGFFATIGLLLIYASIRVDLPIMGKILLLAIAVWLVFVILKRYRNSMQQPRRGSAEDMVRCAACGVHLPKSDSVSKNDLYYCSVAHLEQHHER